MPHRGHLVADRDRRNHDHSPLPGVVTTKPGSATIPFPGISAELVDQKGTPIPIGGGLLGAHRAVARNVAYHLWRRRPLPRDLLEQVPNKYFAGDGAKLDADGYWWILGRVDDVLNVAGHRIGTMEVESALVDHPSVAEAAVVGKFHELKGQALAAFVTLKEGNAPSAQLKDDLKDHVAKKIGAIARPDDILFSADIAQDRSGKIMRRLLKDIADGRALGDTTTWRTPLWWRSSRTSTRVRSKR